MTSVVVVGLGRMGLPVARHLRRAGFDVRGVDFDPARRAHATGVAVHPDLTGAVEVLMTVLPGPPELRSAMLDDHGLLSRMETGACWLDLTSNDPRVAAEVAAEARRRGVLSVGAPMGGGPSDAEAGMLRFFVGGSSEAVAVATPILEALARPDGISYLGADVGAGHTTKLLANTLWFGQALAATEALLIGQAQGLDLRTLREALAASAGRSGFLLDHADALLAGDYLTTFGIDRVVEELDTVTQLASSSRSPAPLTELVAELHRMALRRFGPIDGELLAAKLLESEAGRTLRAP